MRLDKFLKVSRVIKRRTVANEACDNGRVSINGKVAKAGTAVKPGDVVQVDFANGSTKFEVLTVEDNVKKSGAADMYRIITSLALAFFLFLGGLAGCSQKPDAGTKEEIPFMAASEDYVVKISHFKVYDEQFCYLFSSTARELAGGYYTKEWLGENFEKVFDRTLEVCRETVAMYDAAVANGFTISLWENEEISASANDRISANLLLAQNENLNSWDEVSIRLTGMNHNEYKRFLRTLYPVEKYTAHLLKEYNPTPEEQAEFYRNHQDEFKTCSVGKIYLPEKDEEGNSNKELAEKLLDMAIKNAYPFEILARGWSLDANVVKDSGNVDLCTKDDRLPIQLIQWVKEQKEDENIPQLIHVEGDGYYILQLQGFKTYEDSSTLRLLVLDVMEDQMLADHKRKISNQEVYKFQDYRKEEAVLLLKTFLEGRAQ